VISPVGGAIVWASSFEMVFVACFGVGVLAFLLSLGLPPGSADAKLKEEDEDELSLRKLGDVLHDRILLPWYGIIVVNMFFVGILFGFFPVYVHSLGYNQLRNGLVSQLARDGRLASSLGMAGSFKELGDMLGPLLIGAIAQAFGLKVSFVTCGVVGLAGIGVLKFAIGQRAEQ